jgi:hypothetical protein
MSITSGFVETEWSNYGAKYIVFTGSAAQSYTLGDATLTPGLSVVLKNQSTAAVTVSGPSSQTIDGAATLVLAFQNNQAVLFSDGHNWNIMSGSAAAGSVLAASAFKTAQTASVASTPLFTAPVAGTYRATVTLITTTAGSAGTVDASIVSNNGSAANTQVTSTCSLATLGTELSQVVTFYSAAGQVVDYLTTVASAAGTPAYSVSVVVELLA